MHYFPITQNAAFAQMINGILADDNNAFNETVGVITWNKNKLQSAIDRAKQDKGPIIITGQAEMIKDTVYLQAHDSIKNKTKSMISIQTLCQDETQTLLLFLSNQDPVQQRLITQAVSRFQNACCFITHPDHERELIGLSALFKSWDGLADWQGNSPKQEQVFNALLLAARYIDCPIITSTLNHSCQTLWPPRHLPSPDIDWVRLETQDMARIGDEIDRLIALAANEKTAGPYSYHLLNHNELASKISPHWFQETFLNQQLRPTPINVPPREWGILSNTLLDSFLGNFLTIDAGYFTMGAPLGVGEADNSPKHRIYLADYAIQKTVLAQGFYNQITGNPLQSNTANMPATPLSFYDARDLCAFLTQEALSKNMILPDQHITLPSEAQWEKAARGPNGLVYPWGNSFEPDYCHHRKDDQDTNPSQIHPIGSLPDKANSPYGCIDMVGNTWEWTRSLWGLSFNKTAFPYPYQPNFERENLNAPSTMRRVIRGGAYYYDSYCLQNFIRNNRRPTDHPIGSSVRFVLEPKP